MDFPMNLNLDLVDSLSHRPVVFTKIAFLLSSTGIWTPNPSFRGVSNLGFALHRDRAWRLCAPLSDPMPLFDWDKNAHSIGPPITAKVKDENGHWIKCESNGFVEDVVEVNNTTGYRVVPTGEWSANIYKPLVHDLDKDEFYEVDLHGVCNCPAYQKNPQVGCKHWDYLWLAKVCGK